MVTVLTINSILTTGMTTAHQVALAVAPVVPESVDDDDILGEVSTDRHPLMVYNACAHPGSATLLARRLAPTLTGAVRRTAQHEQGTELAIGQRHAMFYAGPLPEGRLPEFEFAGALTGMVELLGAPTEVIRNEHSDLAAIVERWDHLPDGESSSRLALRSALAQRCSPEDTKVDVAPDAHGWGVALATLHVASAKVFGAPELEATLLAKTLTETMRVSGDIAMHRVDSSVSRLGAAEELGAAIRIHGNCRLASFRRRGRQWLMAVDAGDGTLPLSVRSARNSPLADVASVLEQVVATAESELAETPGMPGDRELMVITEAWVERVADHVIRGYVSVPGVSELLPPDRLGRDALVAVFQTVSQVRTVIARSNRGAELSFPLSAVSRALLGVSER
jgi:predicted trehalose synthase